MCERARKVFYRLFRSIKLTDLLSDQQTAWDGCAGKKWTEKEREREKKKERVRTNFQINKHTHTYTHARTHAHMDAHKEERTGGHWRWKMFC